eukprot:GHVT01076098.1.p1 GENE.GHVT01076098.1~~GHVT01076098.1.p1  ORF type:complete len:337 (-),score=75.69 GHVT01076098.1:1179-2189(-)
MASPAVGALPCPREAAGGTSFWVGCGVSPGAASDSASSAEASNEAMLEEADAYLLHLQRWQDAREVDRTHDTATPLCPKLSPRTPSDALTGAALNATIPLARDSDDPDDPNVKQPVKNRPLPVDECGDQLTIADEHSDHAEALVDEAVAEFAGWRDAVSSSFTTCSNELDFLKQSSSQLHQDLQAAHESLLKSIHNQPVVLMDDVHTDWEDEQEEGKGAEQEEGEEHESSHAQATWLHGHSPQSALDDTSERPRRSDGHDFPRTKSIGGQDGGPRLVTSSQQDGLRIGAISLSELADRLNQVSGSVTATAPPGSGMRLHSTKCCLAPGPSSSSGAD